MLNAGRTRFALRARHALLLAPLALATLSASAFADGPDFGLFAQCTLGADCFVQQFPDMEVGPATADPFCGIATYDGHDGIDLRVLSMADVARGVPVTAIGDGTVLRVRDGEPDKLVVTDADRQAVADKECGNGMVVDHGGGFEAQYCHLKQSSIVVKPGDAVKRGATLGAVGASGMAAFPHVHLTLRRDGKPVDPATGRALTEGCARDLSGVSPLFSADVAAAMGRGDSQLIGMGIAGDIVDHAALAVVGPPSTATKDSGAIVGWGWFINLQQGDRIAMRLTGPDGKDVARQVSEPLERSKATYSSFAGKRGKPAPGAWEFSVTLFRGSEPVLEKTTRYEVK